MLCHHSQKKEQYVSRRNLSAISYPMKNYRDICPLCARVKCISMHEWRKVGPMLRQESNTPYRLNKWLNYRFIYSNLLVVITVSFCVHHPSLLYASAWGITLHVAVVRDICLRCQVFTPNRGDRGYMSQFELSHFENKQNYGSLRILFNIFAWTCFLFIRVCCQLNTN